MDAQSSLSSTQDPRDVNQPERTLIMTPATTGYEPTLLDQRTPQEVSPVTPPIPADRDGANSTESVRHDVLVSNRPSMPVGPPTCHDFHGVTSHTHRPQPIIGWPESLGLTLGASLIGIVVMLTRMLLP